jgi:phage shock protein PspC (stress-responsive transcriptional regulator)
MEKRLYRSRTDQMVGGVCGGLGAYLGIDPTIVRLFFLLLLLGSGVGLGLYVILWIVIPYPDQGQPGTAETMRTGAQELAERVRGASEDVAQALRRPNPQTGLIVGAGLVILGVIFLIENMNLPWLRWLRFDVIWPALLILAGVVMIWRRVRKD